MRVFGNLNNRIDETAGYKAPTEDLVGQGATATLYSDRRAGTIVRVTPTQIHWQADKAIRTDRNGQSHDQTYVYEPNPRAPIYIFRYSRINRCWQANSYIGLIIGERDEYFDPDF